MGMIHGGGGAISDEIKRAVFSRENFQVNEMVSSAQIEYLNGVIAVYSLYQYQEGFQSSMGTHEDKFGREKT